MLLDIALSIETSQLLKTSWISSGRIKGLLFTHHFQGLLPWCKDGVDYGHQINWTSFGQKSHLRKLLLLINWLLSATKSPILINPLLFDLELNVDLPLMQMNLLFFITVFDIWRVIAQFHSYVRLRNIQGHPTRKIGKTLRMQFSASSYRFMVF